MKIIQPIDYLFYAIFELQKRVQPDLPGYTDSYRSFNTLMFMAMLFTLNTMTALYKYVDNKSIIYIAPVYIVLNYFLFQYKKRYLRIFKNYEASKKLYWIENIFILMYLISTIILFGITR